MPEPTTATPPASSGTETTTDRYRALLDRLGAARARALDAAALTPDISAMATGIAAGYLHATADIICAFEGTEAAQAYVRQQITDVEAQNTSAGDGAR
ncbi:hypothetical protein [Streptomyces lavendofoliae]|uniref:Uncharacterized protein n=1 Tax=Streptomyces lavendofoliae TaxID=67314 RepID=A0A918M722_9ACTN|nr:hypothetical protein [Streptomyces lavendofoliae]GGU62430.1 hypothetical protein GCM10010274_59020 [Streptomyces lavendofoliae]